MWASSELVVFIWMSTISIGIITSLQETDSFSLFMVRGRSILDDQRALLAFVFLLVVGAAVAAGVVWMGTWALFSVEVRLDADDCSLEHNEPAPPAAATKKRAVSFKCDKVSSSTSVMTLASADAATAGASASDSTTAKTAGVLIASLEHVVPSLGISVTAGGLGKVLRMQHAHAQQGNSPRRHIFVFPMISGIEYDGFNETPHHQPLQGGAVKIRVYREKPAEESDVDASGASCGAEGEKTSSEGAQQHAIEFIALEHPLFLQRDKQSIYPDARRRHDFLHFFGLWNRCVAELLLRCRDADEVGIFHCLDYHTALAPSYISVWGAPPVPTAVTLHNALYQGSLLGVLSESEWSAVAAALQLPNVRSIAGFEGDLNLLRAAISHVHSEQKGIGITAVSHQVTTAHKLTNTHTAL